MRQEDLQDGELKRKTAKDNNDASIKKGELKLKEASNAADIKNKEKLGELYDEKRKTEKSKQNKNASDADANQRRARAVERKQKADAQPKQSITAYVRDVDGKVLNTIKTSGTLPQMDRHNRNSRAQSKNAGNKMKNR